MSSLRPPPANRVKGYAELGLWDDRQLQDGVEVAASKRPDHVAVVDLHATVTWSDLVSLIHSGVRRLANNGIGSGDAVAIVAGNVVEAVVAYHSVLRIGAVAVLLDRRCGPADLQVALEAVPVSLVILPQSESARLEGQLGDMRVVSLEEFVGRPDVLRGGEYWSEPDRNVPAVILFTSGTTSRPKGVVHSINTITSGGRNMAITTGANETSVIYLVSPVTSITGVIQMHLAADCHSTLVLDDAFDAEESLIRINRRQATILGGAPVIVERLINTVDRRDDKSIALRTLAVGGTLLPRAFLERIMDQYGIDVARVYGSSEAPNATGRLSKDDRRRELSDDGALMPGTEVRVGSSVHPQEGLLRGPAVFLGYLDDSHNAESFDGDWYRSGDLLEVADGRLTVVGRLKEIANRNGLKISLNEIDSAMLGQPDIEESASFAAPDPMTGEHLAVAVVPKEGVGITLDKVLTHLRMAGIATRKLPEQLVIWDEPLPRTPSGKVIRARLLMDAPSRLSYYADRLRS